ncbi:O-antigen ligase family protein [Flavobacterium sp. WC2429]|uniref:O-antigen ligase family protein n=1 Tax=Flavobacterium sp. WC2429 TaxID=3234140 RepID=A0AB39WL46_9FLAO
MTKPIKPSSENRENIEFNTDNKVYYETILLLFIVSFLIIDFFPQFGSVEIIAPQFLYLSVINIITSLFFYKNQDLISNGLAAVFKKSILFKTYIGFLVLCSISLVSANNFSLAVVNFMQIITVFSLFINLSVLLYNNFDLIYKIALLVAISVFAQAYLALSDFIGTSKSTDITNGLSMLKGNTGNINIFAASLAGKIPFILLAITHFTKWKKWLLVLSLFLATILIFLTASRASYISLFVEIILFIIVFLKINNQKKQNYINYISIILPLLIAFFVANIIFEKSNNNDRYKSVTNRVLQISSSKEKDASKNARLTYWGNAFEIIKKNPVLGIGLGNWKIESIAYEKTQTNDLQISAHPHNDFLEIAAETGILNSIVYLFIFIFGLLLNLKNIFNEKEKEAQIIASLALLLMVSYGIDALFNFPLYRPTMQINFCFFLALTILNANPIATIKEFHFKKIVTITLILLSTSTLYFSYSSFKAYRLENETRIDLSQEETKYQFTASEIANRIPLFPNVATTSEPYIELAGIYSLKEKKYEEALKYFNNSQRINPHTGRTEWYKYRIYKELGNTDSAYIYSKKAFEIRPRSEDYYLTAIVVETIKKDTAAILQIHNQFTKYIQKPNIWINTSSALAQSQYSNKALIQFIDSGLLVFPNDTTLLNRKKSFQNDGLRTNTISSKPVKNEAVKPNNITIANQYGTESKYDKAIVYYKKALLDDPKNIIITQNIGICYFKLNQFKTAIIYLEKTLNSPTLTDGKTEFLLGASYLNTKNREKGCQNLKLAENKNYPGAAALVVQYCN